MAIYEACHNPLCGSRLGPLSTRRPKLFCSKECRTEHLTLSKAARLLCALGQAETWQVLTKLDDGQRDP